MKNARKMKILFLFIFTILFFPVTLVSSQLVCSVKSSCSASEVGIFKMSSTNNAHAGTLSSTYSNVVCCSGVSGLGNSCSGNFSRVLRLSSSDNAHAEHKDNSNYGVVVCISGSVLGVDCLYSSPCPANYTCLASVSSSDTYFTNAHVGDCNAYTTKVCCKVPGPPVCARNNPTVDITPASQPGRPGDRLTYSVAVTNNDNDVCGASVFNLTVASCPSGWLCQLDKNSFTLSPGRTNSTTVNVTSPSTASLGTYSFRVRATNTANTSYWGEDSANYVIGPYCIACPWGGDSGEHCCNDDNRCEANSCGNGGCGAAPACDEKSRDDVLEDICSFGNSFTKDKCDESCQVADTSICDAQCGADLRCNNVEINQQGSCPAGEACDNSCHCSMPIIVSFEAWLGVERTNFTVGQTFPVNVYVKNTGTVKDSYNFTITYPSSVKTRIYDSRIDDVSPKTVVKTTIDLTILELTSGTITVSVRSATNPSSVKTLNLIIGSGTPNMADFDVFSLLQIIGICLVILSTKKLIRIT